MKEKLNLGSEQSAPQHETSKAEHAEQHVKLDAKHEAAKRTAEKSAAEDVKRLHKKIEQEAQTAEELRHNMDTSKDKDSDKAFSRAQSKPSASQTISQVRRHLKPAERKFSKVIHNDAVENVSDVVGATVARPSGMLYGAIFSLIASIGLLVIAKTYGYEYNAFIGILAFVGGFAAGLFVEALTKLMRIGKRN